MRLSINRKVAAAVATAALVLVTIPVASPASAVQACSAGSTCEGALAGSLGVSPFKIQMPATFNGTVLLFNHGYRFSGPIPAAFAGPSALGLTTNPAYAATSVPAFAAAPPLGFGSAIAYQSTNLAQVAPNATVAANLLSQGYALAGVGYSAQGWAAAEALDADSQLIKYINSGAISGVKKLMVWGESFGGFVSALVAERFPGKVAGVLPTCAPLAGPEQAMQSAMTVMFTWKTLIAPTLRVANYQSYPQALSDLATVLQTLGAVGAGQLSVSSRGFPIAQANLLAGLMGGEPTVSPVYDGITVNPIVATLAANPAIGPGLAPAAASAQGYSPVTAGASSAAAMLQNVGAAAALGIMVRYDLEQRARAIAGIAPTDSANFTDNVQVSYSTLLSSEDSGEFGDTLNASTAVAGGVLKVMLGTLDASKGNPALRFPANDAAVKAVRSIPAPTGKYAVPTVLLQTTYDPVVAAGNTSFFAALLSKSAAGQGKLVRVGQYYTVPPADGWTKFLPGAKAPDSASSAAAASSGVGHCNWTVDGGVQVTNAVVALDRMVAASSAKDIKAINHFMWKTVEVNGDGFFEPDTLPHPQLAR